MFPPPRNTVITATKDSKIFASFSDKKLEEVGNDDIDDDNFDEDDFDDTLFVVAAILLGTNVGLLLEANTSIFNDTVERKQM